MDYLYNIDCLEFMENYMAVGHTAVTITSPPYNMNLRIRNGKYCSRQVVKELTTKYKNFPDNLPMEEYYEFNKEIINYLLQVSNLVFYNVQFLTGNKRALVNTMEAFKEQLNKVII